MQGCVSGGGRTGELVLLLLRLPLRLLALSHSHSARELAAKCVAVIGGVYIEMKLFNEESDSGEAPLGRTDVVVSVGACAGRDQQSGDAVFVGDHRVRSARQKELHAVEIADRSGFPEGRGSDVAGGLIRLSERRVPESAAQSNVRVCAVVQHHIHQIEIRRVLAFD